jgi:hypothetical protein
LPFKSRALAYFHPISFTGITITITITHYNYSLHLQLQLLLGSFVIPSSYAYLLVCKPSIEEDHMIQWDLSKNVIWTRSFLIHLAPFLFHILDINANQDKLISIYKAKSKNTIILWSIIAYALFGVIYSLIYPDNEEIKELQGITTSQYLLSDKLISLLASIFAFLLLYMMILRKT